MVSLAGSQEALEELFAAWTKTFYLHEGEVDVVEQDGQVVGAALWARPGRPRKFIDDLKMIGTYLRQLGWRIFPGLVREMQNARVNPSEPHWYLFAIGVDPSTQGQGFGSDLIRHGLDRAG